MLLSAACARLSHSGALGPRGGRGGTFYRRHAGDVGGRDPAKGRVSYCHARKHLATRQCLGVPRSEAGTSCPSCSLLNASASMFKRPR